MKNGKAKKQRQIAAAGKERERRTGGGGGGFERVSKENALLSWRLKRAESRADTRKRKRKRDNWRRGEGRRHSGDGKRKKSVREKRTARSLRLTLFLPPPPSLSSFCPDKYLNRRRETRTQNRARIWKMETRRWKIAVNASGSGRRRSGSIGGAREKQTERERDTPFDRRACPPEAGTRTNRNYSPSILSSRSHRAPETTRCIGNTVEKCVAHPAGENAAANYLRNLRKNICAFEQRRGREGEGTREDRRSWRKRRGFCAIKIKRDPFSSFATCQALLWRQGNGISHFLNAEQFLAREGNR